MGRFEAPLPRAAPGMDGETGRPMWARDGHRGDLLSEREARAAPVVGLMDGAPQVSNWRHRPATAWGAFKEPGEEMNWGTYQTRPAAERPYPARSCTTQRPPPEWSPVGHPVFSEDPPPPPCMIWPGPSFKALTVLRRAASTGTAFSLSRSQLTLEGTAISVEESEEENEDLMLDMTYRHTDYVPTECETSGTDVPMLEGVACGEAAAVHDLQRISAEADAEHGADASQSTQSPLPEATQPGKDTPLQGTAEAPIDLPENVFQQLADRGLAVHKASLNTSPMTGGPWLMNSDMATPGVTPAAGLALSDSSVMGSGRGFKAEAAGSARVGKRLISAATRDASMLGVGGRMAPPATPVGIDDELQGPISEAAPRCRAPRSLSPRSLSLMAVPPVSPVTPGMPLGRQSPQASTRSFASVVSSSVGNEMDAAEPVREVPKPTPFGAYDAGPQGEICFTNKSAKSLKSLSMPTSVMRPTTSSTTLLGYQAERSSAVLTQADKSMLADDSPTWEDRSMEPSQDWGRRSRRESLTWPRGRSRLALASDDDGYDMRSPRPSIVSMSFDDALLVGQDEVLPSPSRRGSCRSRQSGDRDSVPMEASARYPTQSTVGKPVIFGRETSLETVDTARESIMEVKTPASKWKSVSSRDLPPTPIQPQPSLRTQTDAPEDIPASRRPSVASRTRGRSRGKSVLFELGPRHQSVSPRDMGRRSLTTSPRTAAGSSRELSIRKRSSISPKPQSVSHSFALSCDSDTEITHFEQVVRIDSRNSLLSSCGSSTIDGMAALGTAVGLGASARSSKSLRDMSRAKTAGSFGKAKSPTMQRERAHTTSSEQASRRRLASPMGPGSSRTLSLNRERTASRSRLNRDRASSRASIRGRDRASSTKSQIGGLHGWGKGSFYPDVPPCTPRHATSDLLTPGTEEGWLGVRHPLDTSVPLLSVMPPSTNNSMAFPPSCVYAPESRHGSTVAMDSGGMGRAMEEVPLGLLNDEYDVSDVLNAQLFLKVQSSDRLSSRGAKKGVGDAGERTLPQLSSDSIGVELTTDTTGERAN